jgi:ribosome-associated protein
VNNDQSSPPETTITDQASNNGQLADRLAQPLASLETACLAAQLIDDKKGRDITLLDVRAVTSLADYFVIATADSRPQLRAIANSIRQTLSHDHHQQPVAKPTRYAPNAGEGWQLLDYGDVIIHVLSPEDRQFYQLEAFWDHADVLPNSYWQKPNTTPNNG